MTNEHLAQRNILLAGATGLVGGQMLQALLNKPDVGQVHVLLRRPLAVQHPKLRAHVVDFGALPTLPPVDEVYLALATTIRVAGSQDAFRAVDLTANLAVAEAGFTAGARRLAVVSAVGANARSSTFYLRIKGELEDALQRLDLTALVVARPSLLLGDRDALKQPSRLGEKIATPVMKLLAPLLPQHYRPIEGRDVARALVNALPKARGTTILYHKDLMAMAD
ncbi:MAG: hypothetical protein QM639_07365 [Rhodocyclaceae bacterium]